MSTDSFQKFVSEELPKRINTEQDSATLEANKVPVSTGQGLQVIFKDIDTYNLKTSVVTDDLIVAPIDQQCYSVDINVNRNITLQDGPDGRSCVVVLTLTGGDNVPTFLGTNVKLSDSKEITLFPPSSS